MFTKHFFVHTGKNWTACCLKHPALILRNNILLNYMHCSPFGRSVKPVTQIFLVVLHPFSFFIPPSPLLTFRFVMNKFSAQATVSNNDIWCYG
jgi:hypothetical protein